MSGIPASSVVVSVSPTVFPSSQTVCVESLSAAVCLGKVFFEIYPSSETTDKIAASLRLHQGSGCLYPAPSRRTTELSWPAFEVLREIPYYVSVRDYVISVSQ